MRPSLISMLRRYKNGGKGVQDSRKIRLEDTAVVRRKKRTEEFMKRRCIAVNEDPNSLECSLRILQEASSKTIGDITKATANLAEFMSSKERETFDLAIVSGVLPTLVEFLNVDEVPVLQSSAVSVIASLTSGNTDHKLAVVGAGALPELVNLMTSRQRDIAEQAILALGNVAGEGWSFTRAILELNVLEPLRSILCRGDKITGTSPTPESTILSNTVWLIRSLCSNRCHPAPARLAREFVHLIANILDSKDACMVAEGCAALSSLTNSTRERVDDVICAGLVPRLVELLQDTVNLKALIHALRVLAHISAGEEDQLRVILDCNVLGSLRGLLEYTRADVDSLCILGNLALNDSDRIQSIIEACLLEPLVHVITKSGFQSKRLSAWAANNLSASCEPRQLDALIQAYIPGALWRLLDLWDLQTSLLVLDSLENMFVLVSNQDQVRMLRRQMKENGGLKRLEWLRLNTGRNVAKRAATLMELYLRHRLIEH